MVIAPIIEGQVNRMLDSTKTKQTTDDVRGLAGGILISSAVRKSGWPLAERGWSSEFSGYILVKVQT